MTYRLLTPQQQSARLINWWKEFGHVVKAHAEGSRIEFFAPHGEWILYPEDTTPGWYPGMSYRVYKPAKEQAGGRNNAGIT